MACLSTSTIQPLPQPKSLVVGDVKTTYLPIKFRDYIVSVTDGPQGRTVSIYEPRDYGVSILLSPEDIKELIPILQEIVSD